VPRVVVLLALSSLAPFSLQPAKAQSCAGELRVLVRDSQEAPIFNAKVQVTSDSVELGVRQTPTSGLLEFGRTPCGPLSVRATREGFEDAVVNVSVVETSIVDAIITLNPRMARQSLDVTDTPPPVEQSSSQNYELKPDEVRNLPANPATISDALPLVPGVVRSPDGELKLDGSGEQRSSLVVNQSDVTDPATGKFGQTIPVDSIESVNVLSTPFLAQYGRFTQSVVAVETKRGGDRWHTDLNDPFPDFRIRSYHMVGIRNETPRMAIGGPIIRNRLFVISALQYILDKVPNRTLGFPYNESKHERVNSFTQVDYMLSQRQIVNATFHYNPEHINFVNPDYFNPQPVTPSYAQRAYAATVADHLALWGGTLDTSLSYQRFHTFIGAQGPDDEIVTPVGARGNYFGTQTRDAFRREWLEVWSPAPISVFGPHQLKIGTSLTVSTNHGEFTYRPVDVLDTNGLILERIQFSSPGPYKRNDLEFTGYAQDHWTLTPRLALDSGIRVEHQRLASSLRVAPRAGLAITPFSNHRTVIRMGYGQFYDHIPLDVYAFSRYPNRTILTYDPQGQLESIDQYVNVIGSVTGPKSFLVSGQRVAGAFSPRGLTWNAQIEHRFSKLLRLRGVYTDNRSVGLIILHPEQIEGTNAIVLEGDGNSRYRQAEITAKLGWENGQQLVFSYTRSRAEGNQNVFDSFVGNFGQPFIRPNVYSNLPGDLPNRFLTWGHVNIPFQKLQMLPTIEYRNGFPYIALDEKQNYVGMPNSDATRFPNFFSLDSRLMRDFRLRSKYTIRLSVTGFNLTNHFNALAVHCNTADPQNGVFFGNYHRRYRFDFEVLF
jgi:hypothetical protein